MAYMDDADAANARALCEERPDLVKTDTTFAYTSALLEHLSYFVLAEDGADESVAQTTLAHAIRLNPFAAVLLARSDAFVQNMHPSAMVDLVHDKYERIERARSRRQDAARRRKNTTPTNTTRHHDDVDPDETRAMDAMEYGLSGVSCWLDAPDGLERIERLVESNECIRNMHTLCVRKLRTVSEPSAYPALRMFAKILRLLVDERDNDDDDDGVPATGSDTSTSAARNAAVPPDAQRARKKSKSARRRERSGYSRSVNRKKNVYGGHANDLSVYIE